MFGSPGYYVRTFALVATYIPIYPARTEAILPSIANIVCQSIKLQLLQTLKQQK